MKIVALLLLAFPVATFACQCGTSDLTQAAAQADYIYIGKVVESRMQSDKTILNKLEAQEVIKGNPSTFILMNETLETSLCAQSTSVGSWYVVFGETGKVSELTVCTETQGVWQYSEDQLNEIKKAANKAQQYGR